MAHKFSNNFRYSSSLERKLNASIKVTCRKSRPHRKPCGHCGQLLSLKTYRKHYKKYFNLDSCSWNSIISASDVPVQNTGQELSEACSEREEVLNSNSDCDTNPDSEMSEEEIWNQVDDDVPESLNSETNSNGPQLPDSSQKKLVKWFVGFLLRFQSKYYISDSALNSLLKFLSTFLKVLGRFSEFMAILGSEFPSSVYQLKKCANTQDNFVKYTVCSKCNTIYNLEESIDRSRTTLTSRMCSHVAFPNHPQSSRRIACGKQLMKSVELVNSQKILHPHKVYCYNSLISTLKNFLLRPNFVNQCNEWKNRNNDLLTDIYDGKLWKDFEHLNGQPFLRDTFTLAFTLNIDWFQPYKLTTSSVGVIFLSILNFPRSLRNKRGNIILIGLIPGPSEPTKDVNSFLKPLVKELQDLWKGVEMFVDNNGKKVILNVRGALLCVACDLPAGRKVCGFMGPSSRLGCSRCLKKFEGGVGSMNYSGFDVSSWPPRCAQRHRRIAAQLSSCNTKQKKNDLESTTGCRYTCLLDLPYFDPPRMLIVDPMHNLFLGSGKKMLKVWLENDIINASHFHKVQSYIDKFVTPCDIGRIPRKIETGFSGFTADQLKNWITIYSIPVLYGILPEADFECWRYFVLACRIFCKTSLSASDIQLAHVLVLAFCRKVESIYGESKITPNMHMHCHLREVLLDYGPVHSVWLFAFERFNGILGNQPTNNKHIETQLMRNFLQDMFAYSYNFPDDFKDDFEPVCKLGDQAVGSLRNFCTTSPIEYPAVAKRSVLSRDCMQYMKEIVEKINSNENISLNSAFFKYSSLIINGLPYKCACKKNGIFADLITKISWDFSLFGRFPTTMADTDLSGSNNRPAKIHYFIKASFTTESTDDLHYITLAYVSWCFPHPNIKEIGKPAEVWCHDLYERDGPHSFVPISFIKGRCAHSISTLNDEQVLLIVPLCE